MSRSVFLIAASALALTACQPAARSDDALEAETPPPVNDEGATIESVDAAAEASNDEDGHGDADHDEDDHDDDHDEHGNDAHAEDEHDEHGEDEHDHADDEHGEDAHDHDEDDHAGGEAHVHGLSDLAASLDGATLSVNVEGALANFDLDESLRELADTAPYTDTTVTIIGGDCTRDSAAASIRPIGDHGNLMIDLTYTCGEPDAIEAIDVTGFQSFDGFEEVNAVFLTDSGQTAETLTESDTRLDID